jgi:competence protein ComEC
VLYLKTGGALTWMLISYAMLLLGFLLHRKRVLRVVLPVSLSLSMLVGIILYTEHFYRSNDCVTVLDVGQGQCITAFAGDVTAVIDCGNTNTIENAGTIAGEYLLSCGRRSVEMLILTHLHSDHADGVVRLMEMLPVDTLILPADGEDDEKLRNSILACAARHGTRVELIDSNAQLRCGRLDAMLYKLSDDGDVNERCLMIDLAVGGRHLLVTADAPKAMERELAAQADLEDTDILIVGHHGSKYASSDELLKEVGGGLAVISVGYNNYGHPAPETLEALDACGYQVKRTDVDGTVEIRLEREHG